MERQCQCYKSLKEPDKQCPHPALANSHYCGIHKNCHHPTITLPSTKVKDISKSTPMSMSKPIDSLVTHKQRQQPPETKTKTSMARRLVRLSGPTCLYHYNDLIHKRIALIGELHNLKSLCQGNQPAIEVQYWVDQLVRESSHCIDLFIEQSYGVFGHDKELRPLSTYDSPINAMRVSFSHCYHERTCYEGRLRVHYIDLRDFYQSQTQVLAEGILGQLVSQLDYMFENKDQNDQFYRLMLRYVIGLQPDARDQFNLYIKYLVETKKRTLEGWSFEYYGYLINDVIRHIQKEFSKMMPEINRTHFLETLIECYFDPEFIRVKPTDSYYGLGLIQQDAYLLTRLFIQYDKAKQSRGPKHCQSLTNDYCIIYGGAHHILIYRLFFRKMFGQEPDLVVVKQPDQDCLTFPQPYDFWENLI